MLRLRRDYLRFPGGRGKAFTVSYDDGVIYDGRFINLLKKYGIRGTFNLNSGLMGTKDLLVQGDMEVNHEKYKWEELQDVYADVEIAVHSLTHPDLARMPAASVAYEVSADKANLETLVGEPVQGMAYPFGTYNDEVVQVLKQCGIVYSRTTKNTHEFGLPEEFLTWHPTCHHRDERLEELGDTFLANEVINRDARLFYLWGHSYEFEGYEQWDMIEAFLKKMAFHKDIWYATNMEIYEYVQAGRHLIYSSNGNLIKNPSRLDVWMEIDEQVYHIPSGETVVIDAATAMSL
jgi:hypothetical protein